MNRTTTEEQRREFYRRHLRGETYGEIAEGSELSEECVRYWCRKQRKGEGVHSQWHIALRGVLSQFTAAVREKLGELRAEHPRWGANSLRLHLEDEPSLRGKRLPSPASIGRWLHANPANRRKRPKKEWIRPPSAYATRINAGRSTSRWISA